MYKKVVCTNVCCLSFDCKCHHSNFDIFGVSDPSKVYTFKKFPLTHVMHGIFSCENYKKIEKDCNNKINKGTING